MYILPRSYKCEKCGFECKYGPHDNFPAPVIDPDGPVCPKCYVDFLLKNCGTIKPVQQS